jgi:hypothetical protein
MKLPLELNNTTNRKFAKEMQGERAAWKCEDGCSSKMASDNDVHTIRNINLTLEPKSSSLTYIQFNATSTTANILTNIGTLETYYAA